MRHRLLLILILAFTCFAKLCMFDFACFPDTYALLDSPFDVRGLLDLWSRDLWWTLATLSTRVAVSLACVSLVVLCRRRWPAFLILLILDAWIISNIVYFRVNLLFLNWGIIKMATNLGGFEAAILPYLTPRLLALPATTVLAALLVWALDALARRTPAPHRLRAFLAVWALVAVSYGASVCGRTGYIRQHYERPFSPDICSVFSLPHVMQKHVSAIEQETPLYIEFHSVAMYFVRECYRAATYRARLSRVTLTPDEQTLLSTCLQPHAEPNPVDGHLLVVLLESFEGWLLDARDIHGDFVCPRLNAWIRRHPTLVCPNMVAERIYGESGDGQLITLTGLLPLQEGVACNEFATNVYPNFAHFYPDAVCINSSRGVWNKDVTMPAYGFRRIVQSTDPRTAFFGNDDVIFGRAIWELSIASVPTCVLPLSVSMHLPFDYRTLPVDLDEDAITPITRDYLRSARFTDLHLGTLLQWADTAACMANATIVITADHSILSPAQDPLHNHSYIPLIVAGPRITSDIRINDETYQRDVFPTVLHAIGQQSYFFRGLGADLLSQPIDRPLSEPQALRLSDKLLRMNYFSR